MNKAAYYEHVNFAIIMTQEDNFGKNFKKR